MNIAEVLFTNATKMIHHPIATEADHSLLMKLQYGPSPDLLACFIASSFKETRLESRMGAYILPVMVRFSFGRKGSGV